MLARIFLTILCNLLLAVSGSTQDTTGEKKLRVQINATGDTIVLRFIRPQESVRLEGYVLGYGGSMFSKQYIQLPNDAQPYHGEMDAEPKYLISVQPIKPNEVKKQCPGKLDLQRPLHLVIGSVTPTKVMLSWGTLLKTPYTFTTDDCPQDGQYTIRYREQDTTPEPTPEPTQAPDHQWKYQTCPSSSTVIEQLKPNTPYEFEVRADTEEGTSEWTPPVVHNTNVSVTEKLVSLIEKGNKEIEKPFKPPVIPILPGPKETFVVRPVPLPRNLSLPGNRRILDATPTWALPTAFTPITIPPPQSHTHKNMTTPTTNTNQHRETQRVPKTSVQKKDKLHHSKAKTSGQHVPTPPKVPAPGQDTQHQRLTTTTPTRNIHHKHRNRRPHLDAKYQPKTSAPKQHLPTITTTDAQPPPKMTEASNTHDLATSSGQRQPIQGRPKADTPVKPVTQRQREKPTTQVSSGKTQSPLRTTEQRKKLTRPVSSGETRSLLDNTTVQQQGEHQPSAAMSPTADTSLPEMTKCTTSPKTLSAPSTPPAHPLAPELRRTGAEQEAAQANNEGTPDTHTQIHTTKRQPADTQSTHNTEQTSLVGMATPADVRPDSQSPVSKVLRGSSVHTTQHVTESPAMLPDTARALENKGPASSASEPITFREGLFPSTLSQPHPTERLPIADKKPIKISQKPSKKPTKTTKPSTNGKQPGGKQNKPKQQAEKVKQPSKVVQTPDGTRQEPIKHSQQTSRDSKQPIKTGQKPLYRKQKQQTNKGPIKTAQRVSSTTDWPLTTGRPQDGHSQKTPSSPFSVTQYSPPTARLRPTTTQHQQHTHRTGVDTPVHTHRPQMLSTPGPVQTQEDPKHTTITTTTANQIFQQHDNRPLFPLHTISTAQTSTTLTTQCPTQANPNATPHTHIQSVTPVTPNSSRETGPHLATAKRPHSPLAAAPPQHGQPAPSPTLVSEKAGNERGRGSQRPGMWLPGPRPSVTTLLRTRRPRPGPAPVINRPRSRNSTFSPRKTDVAVEGMQGVTLTKPAPKARNGSSVLKPRLRPLKNGLNQVVKPKQEDKGRVHVKHVDPEPALKAIAPPITRETTSQMPQKAPTTTTTTTTSTTTTTTTTTTQVVQATTPFSYFNATRFDSGENASIFSPEPTSKMDAMGKERFTAPHVIYQTDKAPEEPCSITQTLSHFPEDEPSEVNVTAPPRLPPTNLTVVAVEGCPSFVILDWEKADNETTEYEVTSSTKGPQGKEVSILVTNKTHTAVENLKPKSRYEFTVTPKNELGVGPSTEPVTFSTESADPRVAEVTGKRAIWSTFPFKLDMSSECNGPQYIKRTWYRKFVGIQLCNSLRYKIYLSDSLRGPFYHIGDQSGHGEDHCQFVDSFLDGRTGSSTPFNKLPETEGFYRAMRQEPVEFGTIGGNSHINYVSWYECGVAIPGKW
ncbi:hypothetical protein AALO_G00038050 [Alosa alosa]|uniref:Fibronectin type-III domain-containing protein n=1 Tax=Alosa alosa TaxID=278164 RepID=A0AAV6HAP6_9TELE|nr:target of Nesh-SH3-like isoform X1 [Alosa alosa]KAG5283077.1 hypothetical protein AALO_G00038050 [Alosa alosa]